MEISGKLVVVSGASRGIGAATAKLLADEGAKVILLARTAADLEKQTQTIRKAGGKADFYAVDLANSTDTQKIAKSILEEQGTPDILINNAGLGRWLSVDETSIEEAELMIRLPYLAAFTLTRCFLPAMRTRGTGHFLTVNSPACMITIPGSAAYSASRTALKSFTDSLMLDLRGSGIGVTHFVAGKVKSNYFIDNPGSEERVPTISKMIGEMDVDTTAKHILNAIRRGKKRVYKPFMLAVMRLIQWQFPGIVQTLITATGHKPSQ